MATRLGCDTSDQHLGLPKNLQGQEKYERWGGWGCPPVKWSYTCRAPGYRRWDRDKGCQVQERLHWCSNQKSSPVSEGRQRCKPMWGALQKRWEVLDHLSWSWIRFFLLRMQLRQPHRYLNGSHHAHRIQGCPSSRTGICLHILPRCRRSTSTRRCLPTHGTRAILQRYPLNQ